MGIDGVDILCRLVLWIGHLYLTTLQTESTQLTGLTITVGGKVYDYGCVVVGLEDLRHNWG